MRYEKLSSRESEVFADGNKSSHKSSSRTTSTVSLPFRSFTCKRKLCGRAFAFVSCRTLLRTLYRILTNTIHIPTVRFFASQAKRISTICARVRMRRCLYKKKRGNVKPEIYFYTLLIFYINCYIKNMLHIFFKKSIKIKNPGFLHAFKINKQTQSARN